MPCAWAGKPACHGLSCRQHCCCRQQLAASDSIGGASAYHTQLCHTLQAGSDWRLAQPLCREFTSGFASWSARGGSALSQMIQRQSSSLSVVINQAT